jgi:hypothetical protein
LTVETKKDPKKPGLLTEGVRIRKMRADGAFLEETPDFLSAPDSPSSTYPVSGDIAGVVQLCGVAPGALAATMG